MRPHFIPAYSVCHPSTSSASASAISKGRRSDSAVAQKKNVMKPTLGLRGCAEEERDETDDLGDEVPDGVVLCVYDVADVEAACHEGGGSDHDEHRDLVRDHEFGRPHSSDQGVLVVLRPTGNENEERSQGEERHDDEQSGVVVYYVPPSGEGHHACDEDGHTDDQGHGPHVGHPVDLAGDGVLLHEGLETVGDALKESLHTHHGSPSVHHPSEELTLHPQGYQGTDEDHDEDDQHEDDQCEQGARSIGDQPLGHAVAGEDQVDEPCDGSSDDLPQAVGHRIGQVERLERIVRVRHDVRVEVDEVQYAVVRVHHTHLSVSPRHMSI